MAERVVRVKLTATMDQYVAAMGQAAKATRDVGTEGAKLAQTQQAFQLVGRTAFAAGGLMAAGLGVAIAKFADFDQAMSFVQAATHETTANMGLLRDAALEAGASTVFSATESANAIEELSKAGLSTADILGGALKGSLDLAAAGGIGVAEAAGIAATTLNQFGLEGDQASHVADLLAAGAGKAMGDVTDLSAALKQSGLVADQFGISVEETTGTLSAFAAAGLLGSDAGTSMRTMLLRLANPTEEVKKLMGDLGIEAYDAGGQFIGLSGLAGELETSLAGMTQEQKNTTLAMIFGQDAIRGASILLDEGKSGIEDWTAAVDDQGYAAETAAIRLDNLKGDLEALSGAFDTAMISMGSAADGPLRGLVQGLTDLIDGFNDLPDGGQQAVFWIGAVAAATSLAYGSYLLAVPKIAEYNRALEILGPTAQKTSRLIGTLAKVGGSAVAGFAIAGIGADLLINLLKELGPSAEQTANKVKTAADAVELLNGATGSTNTKVAEAMVKGLGDALTNLKDIKTGDLISRGAIESVQQLGGELGKLATSDLPAAQEQFKLLSDSAGLTEKQQAILLTQMPDYRDALTEVATSAGVAATSQNLLELAMGSGAGATETNAAALEQLQGVANDTETAVGSLEDAIRNFGSAQFDTERASADFIQALIDLDTQLADGAASLDMNSQAGVNTKNSMLDVAQSTNDYAGSVAAMGGSTEEVQGILERGRQKIIDTRMALGETEDQARAYADQLIATPENIATQVALNGVGAAESALSYLTRDRVANIFVRSSMSDLNGDVSGTGRMGTFAVGGAVRGPGSSTSDSVTARLSNGEHVWTAAEVRAAGGQEAMYAMRAAVLGKQQYGSVGGSSASTSAPAQVAAPQVQVFIGNEEVTGRVRVVVKDEMNQVTRSALKGGGR